MKLLHFFVLLSLGILKNGECRRDIGERNRIARDASLSSPILPRIYKKNIAQGFSTNYFKTETPGEKYREKNIQDVYDRGFRNLRLRCSAELYEAPYKADNQKFKEFLDKLESVVDKCIEVGVHPIISWIHHKAEANATDDDKTNYLKWWELVADRLKDKSYMLSFNLFTELGKDKCKDVCGDSLRKNAKKYTEWTTEVVKTIRNTKGNNEKRILILASPKKTAKGLSLIKKSIYKDDDYMMVEWHLYASGPNDNKTTEKYWGGGEAGKKNVRNAIQPALDWTDLETCLLAWMPMDNINMTLSQKEAESFSKYFVEQLAQNSIPWSMNVLDNFYDTEKSEWKTEDENYKKLGTTINFDKILKVITKNMKWKN